MFARVKGFVRNHWRKVLFGTIAAQVMFRLTGYAARRYLTYTQIRSHNLLRRLKKKHLFDMMEENFGNTFQEWYELMRENIKRNLNAEKYAEYLKNGNGNKYENWQELKMVAFSSILANIYGSALLIVVLRAQMNVMSGLLYKQNDEVPPGLESFGGSGDGLGARRITPELQHEYLILARHLCTKGMDALCSYIYEKAQQLVGRLSLKQKLTAEDIQHIFFAVRNQKLTDESKRAGVKDWSPITEAWRYMFSDEMTKQFLYPLEAFKQSESERDTFFRILICEAYDLVASEDARVILSFLETHGINHYLDRISEFLSAFPQSDTSGVSEDNAAVDPATDEAFTQPAAPLAKLIPVMNGFLEEEYSQDPWAAVLLHNESLKSFSANIYESYSSKNFD